MRAFRMCDGEVRRSERAVGELEEVVGIVERCRVLRLGLVDDAGVFVVPVNFGAQWDFACDGLAGGPARGAGLALWFHCAGAGRKFAALSALPQAAFEMDVAGGIAPGARACECSCVYESVMGTGTVRRARDLEERREGLTHLMRCCAPDAPRDFPDAALARTEVFALEVATLSAKRNEG